MAQKTLGFVELEWTCKNCGTKNPGMQKTCTNCGAPMPPETAFELAAEQKLIEEKKKLEAAQKGADIFCPYCGTRNPAGTGICTQCGGDLKTGAVRQAGQVVGAYQAGPAPDIACPFCQAKIKATVQRCPNCGGDLTQKSAPKPPPAPAAKAKMPIWLIIAGVAFLLICCVSIGFFAVLNGRTTDTRGEVQSVYWQRSIEIMEIRPAQRSAWQDQLPGDAANVSCSEKMRSTSDSPSGNSKEVCGEPYTVDQGNGTGKVVQDCHYEIYDQYCNYTVKEWQVVDSATSSGNDLFPTWPDLSLRGDQREGSRAENFTVDFSAGGKVYEYHPGNETEFGQYTPGSQWTLKINTFGNVNEVVP